MGADAALTAGARTRLAPGGSAIPLAALGRVLMSADPAGALERALQARFPNQRLTYHASGREAMRVALAQLARRTGRGEVAIPAYACFSIPASAVAAGLRIRLVDVDDEGRLAAHALERLPLDRIAAIVVGNLFGLPEPVAELAERAGAAGATVVDDAAQALGATASDGVVGARGDVGILSFGRGKPLSALGGGAAIWSGRAVAQRADSEAGNDLAERDGSNGLARATGLASLARLAAVARGLAFDVSRRPAVLGVLAQIPALEIGRTIYDADFARGAMPGAAVALAAGLEPELDRLNAARRSMAHGLAEKIRAGSDFRPLVESPGACGVFPRLGVLAPNRERRDRALVDLVRHGATAMYPTPLDAIRELAPHRSEDGACPGAARFCDCLLTLPTHTDLGSGRIEAIVEILSRC